jgi:hypothetical protein
MDLLRGVKAGLQINPNEVAARQFRCSHPPSYSEVVQRLKLIASGMDFLPPGARGATAGLAMSGYLLPKPCIEASPLRYI